MLHSNEPVTTKVELEESQLPGPVWVSGITGLDVSTVDVASVSAAPAGPGTRACTSLVLWLGPSLSAPLRRALGTPAPRLVEVDGTKPGRVAPSSAGGAQMEVVPSGQKRRAVAAIPQSYDEGVELLARLSADVPEASPRLLCAEPRIVRELK